MRIVEDFPFAVEMHDRERIPMRDGTRLAARIWRPTNAARVPAILEYVPYRRRDNTADRDALTHPYFAGHGYAAVRVDLRGSGDSEGVLKGEYLKQEQDDALDIIDWLTQQPWCSGAVGMIGISWGGFNGLQVAARQPRALKAVVSICSTDDRYADDIHFMGGALLLDKITWGSTMFSFNTAPPDPEIVGAAWREMWLDRVENSGFWLEDWLRHQRRDDFYKHGSVCEDWSAITCPVYAVGGWTDGYTNAVFRLLANLKGPRKGLVGPWAHKFPHFAKPGPQIGFLQECLRWWDHWLKGIDTGIMAEPMLRAWIEEPIRPSPYNAEKPGRWVAEAAWPAQDIATTIRPLHPRRLAAPGAATSDAVLTISSPQTTGLTGGKWCPYGAWADQALDQRGDAGGQLVFDSAPLEAAFEVLGAPNLDLELSSDRPQALVAATLCEVFPDGAATRVSYGLLNLSHRDSHDNPTPLEPDKRYRITLKLNDLGHRFGIGNRIRIALSTAYWPLVWPSPEPATLTIRCAHSALRLPVRRPGVHDDALPAFPDAESSAPIAQTHIEPAELAWTVMFDGVTDEHIITRINDDGLRRIDVIDLELGLRSVHRYTIKADDPLSARLDTHYIRRFRRGDWRITGETKITLSATADHFLLRGEMAVREGVTTVATKDWSIEIPRDNV